MRIKALISSIKYVRLWWDVICVRILECVYVSM